MSLRKTLQSFLEHNNNLDNILKYLTELKAETDIISNIVQTKKWSKYFLSNEKDIVLPLILFYDDLETGNALGSHSGVNKFGATYASIACLPPSLKSKLSSILLMSIVRSSDIKKFGYYATFSPTVDEINYLQNEGIFVMYKDLRVKIKFKLLLIVGDNLGLNSIFGFVESFKSTHFCRFCKLDRKDTELCITENLKRLRTKENYAKDLELCDQALTGI